MLSIRPATWRDMTFVRRVRNAPLSLKWSTSNSRVGYLEHLRWWLGRRGARELVYVVLMDEVRSGYVRIKIGCDALCEVSVALSRHAQGQGAASRVIQKAMEQTAGLPGMTGWQARIDSRNLASIRAFEVAGFSISGERQSGEASWLTLERRLPVAQR